MRHHIQKTILDKLATASSKRYGDIKPPELDGNTFGYHLKSLISERYVYKSESGDYRLTAKGKDFIVHRYEESTNVAHSIYLLVIKNGPSYLVRKRNVQPLLNYVGFIHGEPDHRMSVLESAQKRLFDKTGLKVDLTIMGSALITQYINDELQSYSHAIILYGETDVWDIIEGDQTGTNNWSELKDIEYLLPSCHDILSMIKREETWLEQKYHL